MQAILYRQESYKIIGICMEVHRILGKGHSEVVYKDAIEYELNSQEIIYEREKRYQVQYKSTVLAHPYLADFVVFDKIILEVKAAECLVPGHVKQTLNYLAVSKNKLGLLVNFGEDSLIYQRIVL